METETLTLKQLQYLLALDETKHFRHAAELCNISQPSMTVQIQNIEAALGVQLVERSRGNVSFTPVGREVSIRARRILDEIQSLRDYTAEAQKGPMGTIRLGSKETLGPYLLPHVVARLHKQYPELNLYVREGPPKELEYELANGKHDLILAQLPLASADLVVERLFREPLYLALAADHPLVEQEEISVRDLKGLDILSLSPQYHLYQQVEALCQDFGARLVRDYEGTSLDAVRLMGGMGMGAAFMPALYVKSEISSRSEVVVRALKGRQVTRSIGLAWRKSAGKGRTYKELASVIRYVAGRKFPDLTVEGS